MPSAVGAPILPLRQFVIKVHGRCDLACDHCYMYEHADQTWRSKPQAMSPQTLSVAAERIRDHALTHGLTEVRVVIHGGEPLLLGPKRLGEMLGILRSTIDPVTSLRIGMQTNGVLLSESFCETLLQFDVRVGISLDGYRAANDLHRRFANGSSSHDKVLRALELLRQPRYRDLYSGLLCTVDIRNDPVAVYEALVAEKPPRIDFLLPHATWEQPPLRFGDDPAPYATWLTAIHERWLTDGRPVAIRLFESVASTAQGGPSGTEQIGVDSIDLAVIETDGTWEQADSLKTAYHGAPETGLSIFANSIDELAALPEIVRRQGGIEALSATCRACPVVNQCGGGLFAHRYRQLNDFDNPSVYCADLKELITAMNGAMDQVARLDADAGQLPPALIEQIGTGRGDFSANRFLAQTQLSFVRALVSDVHSRHHDRENGSAAWDLLSMIDREDPAVTATVLSHPYLRAWAMRCRKPLIGDELNRPDQIGSLAAAACVHAGVSGRLTVPIIAGRIHLPTVGTAYLPAGDARVATVTVERGGLTIEVGDGTLAVDLGAPPAWWQSTITVRLDDTTIAVEDGDPYRDCHNWSLTERLTASEAREWTETIISAWEIIRMEVPEYLPGLRAGLRAVVPLRPDGSGVSKASTSRHAFGAVAATAATPESLAVNLVHEFQHSKLGAMLDIVDLVDRTSRTQLTVGWRSDPRPPEAVLQGIFAHLAVADVWRTRARREGPGQAEAQGHFLQYCDWTVTAIKSLTESGALTAPGVEFVDRLAAQLEGWTHS